MELECLVDLALVRAQPGDVAERDGARAAVAQRLIAPVVGRAGSSFGSPTSFPRTAKSKINRRRRGIAGASRLKRAAPSGTSATMPLRLFWAARPGSLTRGQWRRYPVAPLGAEKEI